MRMFDIHSKGLKGGNGAGCDIKQKEYLQKICEQYQKEKGYFSQREPVTVFKRPESAAIIWKQWFTKAQGEFVAEMVLVNQNGKYLVDHAMVF